MCAQANSRNLADLGNKAEVSGASVQIRTCNAISRLGTRVKMLVDNIRSFAVYAFLRAMRYHLFSVNTYLTARYLSCGRGGSTLPIARRSMLLVRRVVSSVRSKLPN